MFVSNANYFPLVLKNPVKYFYNLLICRVQQCSGVKYWVTITPITTTTTNITLVILTIEKFSSSRDCMNLVIRLKLAFVCQPMLPLTTIGPHRNPNQVIT